MPKTLLRIGARIVQARHEAGMSQSMLARDIGHPVRTISAIENNDRHPKPETLARIARATGKPIGFFYDLGDLAAQRAHDAPVVLERSARPDSALSSHAA